MAQTQDKHCNGCGWAGHTDSSTCPKCGRELEDDQEQNKESYFSQYRVKKVSRENLKKVKGIAINNDDELISKHERLINNYEYY